MSDDLTCEELVELVTEYLEGGLARHERDRFEEHLASCSGCTNDLDQIRIAIALTGRAAVDDLSVEARNELLATFKAWKRT